MFQKYLVVACLFCACVSASAGTLDDAPFQVTTNRAWRLNKLEFAKPLGVYVVASLTNAQAQVLARIAETDFSQSPAQSLDDICLGVRQSFTRYPSVKVTADEATTFLGYPAHRFVHESRPANKPATYNETIILVVKRAGWTITSLGPLGRTNQVHEVFTLFHKPDEAKPPAKNAN